MTPHGPAPFKFCGYGNCFRSFYRMRGFMPVCEVHWRKPAKFPKDGGPYTGSVFVYVGPTLAKNMEEASKP